VSDVERYYRPVEYWREPVDARRPHYQEARVLSHHHENLWVEADRNTRYLEAHLRRVEPKPNPLVLVVALLMLAVFVGAVLLDLFHPGVAIVAGVGLPLASILVGVSWIQRHYG